MDYHHSPNQSSYTLEFATLLYLSSSSPLLVTMVAKYPVGWDLHVPVFQRGYCQCVNLHSVVAIYDRRSCECVLLNHLFFYSYWIWRYPPQVLMSATWVFASLIIVLRVQVIPAILPSSTCHFFSELQHGITNESSHFFLFVYGWVALQAYYTVRFVPPAMFSFTMLVSAKVYPRYTTFARLLPALTRTQ